MTLQKNLQTFKAVKTFYIHTGNSLYTMDKLNKNNNLLKKQYTKPITNKDWYYWIRDCQRAIYSQQVCSSEPKTKASLVTLASYQ